MGNLTATIRENLMVGNKEYQRLHDEHEQYDHELMELENKKFLTEKEQVEEIRLKKLKLRAKDQMEQLVHRALSV